MRQGRLLGLGMVCLLSTALVCVGCGKENTPKDPVDPKDPQQNEASLPNSDTSVWNDMTGWEDSFTLEQANGYATELPVSAAEREKWMRYYADKMNLALLPTFTEGQTIDEQILLNSGIIFAPWIEVPAEEITDEIYYNYYFDKNQLEDGILRHMGQAVKTSQSTDLLIYDAAEEKYYLEVFGIEESFYLRLEKLLQTKDGDFIGCFNGYSNFSIMEREDLVFQSEDDVFAYFNSDDTEDLPEVAQKVVIKWRPLDDGSGTDVLFLAHEILGQE